MGKFLKSAGVALAAFGLAASAHAASYAEECDCSVWVPKHDGGFRFGIEALYFAPSVAHTEFARTGWPGGAPTNFKTYNVSPEYDWGYKLDGQYMFAGTGNDVKLSYLDIHMSNRSKITFDELSNAVFVYGTVNPPAFFEFPSQTIKALIPAAIVASNLDELKGKYEVDNIAVDLEFGQAVATKNRVKMRFHGGLRYAQVDSKFILTLIDNTDPDILTVTNRSNWEGIGPRFGVDGNVDLAYGFSAVTAFSAAVMVGDSDVKNTYEAFEAGLQDNFSRHVMNFDNRIVLSHDLRLGLRYDWNCDNGNKLGVEVGYHTTNYTDVDNKVSTAGTDIGTSGMYLRLDLLV